MLSRIARLRFRPRFRLRFRRSEATTPSLNENVMSKENSTTNEINKKAFMSIDVKKAAKILLKDNIINKEQKTNNESKVKIMAA